MATTVMTCGCKIRRDQITEEYELEYCIAHEGNALYIEHLKAEVAYHKYHYGLLEKDYKNLRDNPFREEN